VAAGQSKRGAAARKPKPATPAPAKAARKVLGLSPEGRARIFTATKKRWVAVRKAKAKAAGNDPRRRTRRRERIEAAVAAADQRPSPPYEAWIATDPLT
jgi:hypothetical protein